MVKIHYTHVQGWHNETCYYVSLVYVSKNKTMNIKLFFKHKNSGENNNEVLGSVSSIRKGGGEGAKGEISTQSRKGVPVWV